MSSRRLTAAEKRTKAQQRAVSPFMEGRGGQMLRRPDGVVDPCDAITVSGLDAYFARRRARHVPAAGARTATEAAGRQQRSPRKPRPRPVPQTITLLDPKTSGELDPLQHADGAEDVAVETALYVISSVNPWGTARRLAQHTPALQKGLAYGAALGARSIGEALRLAADSGTIQRRLYEDVAAAARADEKAHSMIGIHQIVAAA